MIRMMNDDGDDEDDKDKDEDEGENGDVVDCDAGEVASAARGGQERRSAGSQPAPSEGATEGGGVIIH